MIKREIAAVLQLSLVVDLLGTALTGLYIAPSPMRLFAIVKLFAVICRRAAASTLTVGKVGLTAWQPH